MTLEKSRKYLPPYVSYRTFHNFIERLQQQKMPQRIDRSYWDDKLSWSNGVQLMAAMRFLSLIDANGKPTERLISLVSAKEEQRAQLLRGMTKEAFGFVFKSNVDIESATYSQLEEAFHNAYQLTGDVRRKCVKFFIAMAMEAKIPVSPYITRHIRSSHTGDGTKVVAKKITSRTKQNSIVPQGKDEIPDYASWNGKLLDKFPSFDPSWSDDIKMKWFAAFDELLKRELHKG
jgi:hypothetical protein